MKNLGTLALFFIILTSNLIAQNVGTSADIQDLRHFSLQLSYEHLSRDFSLNDIHQDITSEIYKAQIGFRPSRFVQLYGFAGTSNFPHSLAPSSRQLYLGGGLKTLFIGEVHIEDEETGDSIHIQAGVGLDLQIARLQSAGNEFYDSFGLTRYQGAIDLGLTLFSFTGYIGCKLSRMTGNFVLIDAEETDVKAKGLFSLFMGLNFRMSSHISLVSEFSFFTESFWALGLKFGL